MNEVELSVSESDVIISVGQNQAIIHKFYEIMDKWMCSYQCPCLQEHYFNHRATSEPELNEKGRTKQFTNEEDVLLHYFQPIGRKHVDYFPASFKDCYQDWKLDWDRYSSMKNGYTPGRGGQFDWTTAAQPDFEQLHSVLPEYPQVDPFAIKLMTNLEHAYNCAGLDNKKLFYYSKNYEVEVGIPKDVCSEEQIHS